MSNINSRPIIFLDYDGVVNTIIWRKYPRENQFKARYGFPSDGFVNNYQAICWLNDLYKKIPYNIVVSSTWRFHKNYKQCLYRGGLDKNIPILGCTPRVEGCRGDEIKQWIIDNNFNNKFIILDDDTDMGEYMENLIKCDCYLGFTIKEYEECLYRLRFWKGCGFYV